LIAWKQHISTLPLPPLLPHYTYSQYIKIKKAREIKKMIVLFEEKKDEEMLE